MVFVFTLTDYGCSCYLNTIKTKQTITSHLHRVVYNLDTAVRKYNPMHSSILHEIFTCSTAQKFADTIAKPP